MEFLSATLDNGLAVVAECNPHAYSAALGFFVSTGARDETPDLAGVSHFLEHMAFKGTATRSAADVNRELDAIGAECNACTSEEATVFHTAVLPEHVGRAVALLGDILRPALRLEDFELERQVILEEILMNEDQPPFGADDKCRALHFGPHPLGYSVLGSVASITHLPLEAMREYHRRRYSPTNIVLVGTGRIDFDALVAAARRHCGPWEPCDADRRRDPAPRFAGFHRIHKESASQQYVVQLAPGPAAADRDRYAAKLLATVLGDDTGSRLYWELVDPGLAEHAAMYHVEYDGAGLFVTSMSCNPDELDENLQRISDLFRDAEEFGVTDAELDQAKNKVASRLVLASERPRGRLFFVGSDWVQRREYRSLRDDLDALAAVSPEQIAAVLDRYPLTQNTTVTIGPLTAEQ